MDQYTFSTVSTESCLQGSTARCVLLVEPIAPAPRVAVYWGKCDALQMKVRCE